MKKFNTNETVRFLPNSRMSFVLLCLSLSVILGLIVRLPYFFIYDFALNDGALFVQMSEAIRSNGYLLPETVVYNRTELPFAYPPLSFYLVALLTDLFHFNVLDIVRYMPLVFNILSIGTFVLLASRLIKDKVILLYTSLFFPLIPRSYEWLIMGGGVTRSVGFFFALIAVYQASRILSKYNIRRFIYCSLFLSITVLSHLEWGITGVVTVTLLILSKQFSRRGFVLIVALGAVVLLITSPWWITILIRHGLDPFRAASKTSEWEPLTSESIVSLLKIFDDGLGLPLSGLAVIGWLLSVARKDWFLPVWFIAIFLTTPRHGPTPAAMPLAILASVGLAQFLMPILIQAAAFTKNQFNAVQVIWSKLSSNNTFVQRLLTNHVLVSCVIAVIFLLLMTKINYTKQTPLVALTRSERSAMEWLKDNTPSEGEFIVLTTSSSWQDDRVAEWFPVLSDRKSLTTAQGLEWVPGDVFRSKVESINELKRNQASGDNGLAKYVESHYDSFQYVAIFIPQTNPNYGNFLESGYRVVYDNNSVLVFERIG